MANILQARIMLYWCPYRLPFFVLTHEKKLKSRSVTSGLCYQLMSGIFCLKWWNWNGIYQHNQVCDTKLSQCCYRKYLPKSSKNYLMKCDYEHVLIKNKTRSTGKHCQDRKSFITEKKTFLPKYRNLYNFRTINLHELYKFTAVHHNIPKNEEKNEHKRCTDEKNHKIQTALSWVAQNFFFFCFLF